MKLKRELPKWMCPYCGKTVGYVGNFLAKVFGTRIHSCDSSNVVEPPKPQEPAIKLAVAEKIPFVTQNSIEDLKEIEKLTQKYWCAASVDPRMDKLLVDLSLIHEMLRFYVIPDLEKKLKELDNKPKN